MREEKKGGGEGREERRERERGRRGERGVKEHDNSERMKGFMS